MENITNTLTSNVNGNLGSSSGALAARPTSLIPVNVTVKQSATYIHFSAAHYKVNLAEPMTAQSLSKAHSFLLNIVQQNHLVSNSAQMQLLSLGQALYFPMPKAMLTLANRNNISEKKLFNLGKKAEGYLLPNAENSNSKLQFSNGVSVKLPMLTTVANGKYSVAIKTKQQQLLLKLAPIQSATALTIDDQATTADKKSLVTTLEQAPSTGSKINVNHEYSKLFKSLDSTPLSETTTSVATATHLDANSKEQPASQQYLATAFAKAGSLPRAAIKQSTPSTSLASALFKRLPSINPQALSSLSEPKALQQALQSLKTLSINPSAWQSAPSNHIESLSLLCQLLLGKKAISFTATSASEQLQDKIAMLQSQLGLSAEILQLLAVAEAHKPLANLLNNLNLYQQQSATVDGINHWFFALPYSINHYQEQFEGHFERANEQETQQDKWKLRLKFNLSNSPLLITAIVSGRDTVDNSLNLSITFTSENDSVLSKINLLSPSLRSKVEQLGMSVADVSTQKQAVPATLLPGEHFLVKVEA